jgi:surface carbohydrate biosynthesis protein
MKIVISYHNFIRDFRGSLLLKYILEALGHKVWLTPHWNQDIDLISLTQADVIVGCQVAEKSTAYLAEFAQSAGIHLVLNSSEQFASQENLRTFVTYDRERLNDGVISLQTIACDRLYQYIKNNDELKFKNKYKYIGFPRYDISVDHRLRSIETKVLLGRYGLKRTKRRIIYLSSFLFEETFHDVPKEDMERYGYIKLINKNRELGEWLADVLVNIASHHIGTDDVLLIKKHPWDFSNFLETRLSHPKILFIGQSEYIVPCIDASDFVLHSFSTSAVEAWLMNKPTIAILPSGHRGRLNLSHMEYEIKAEGIDDTIALLRDYPKHGPSEYVHEFLGGLADGKATLRLAREIHHLLPPPRKVFSSRGYISTVRAQTRHWLNMQGIGFKTRLAVNVRMERFMAWEKSRRYVAGLYAPHLRNYVYSNRDYIKAVMTA